MKTKLMLVFFFLALLSACSSSNISTREPEQFQGIAVMRYPMMARMEIKPEKINYVKDCGSNSPEQCKILAYNTALIEHKIDGIFEPLYHYKYAFGSGSMTVLGYPYIYKEFREVTKEDRDLLTSPGSTWIPVQINDRPYITSGDATGIPWYYYVVGGALLLTITTVAAAN